METFRIVGFNPAKAPEKGKEMAKSKATGIEALLGKAVFVRTVTHYYTGRLIGITAGELELSDAAWIADTGRWAAALSTGVLSEIEPFCDNVIVNRSAVVDVTLWRHALPRETK